MSARSEAIRLFPWASFLGLVLIALVGFSHKADAIDERLLGRNALWSVVHRVCAPVSWLTGVSSPCMVVDHENGFATLRPPGEKTHILVTPLNRVKGVESPALQGADAANYWRVAWSQRGQVSAASPRPLGWSEIGMAVNSPYCRSQDQLHIHVDCLDPNLNRRLTDAAKGRKGWFDVSLHPLTRTYRARLLHSGEIDQNIFRMVAQELSRSKDELSAETLAAVMGEETVAVVGFEEPGGQRGFAVLAAGGGGCAEELLDHQCQLAKPGPGGF